MNEKRASIAFLATLGLTTLVGVAGLISSEAPTSPSADGDTQLLIQTFKDHLADLKWMITAGGSSLVAAIGILFWMLVKGQKNTRTYREDITEKVTGLEGATMRQAKTHEETAMLLRSLEAGLSRLNAQAEKKE